MSSRTADVNPSFFFTSIKFLLSTTRTVFFIYLFVCFCFDLNLNKFQEIICWPVSCLCLSGPLQLFHCFHWKRFHDGEKKKRRRKMRTEGTEEWRHDFLMSYVQFSPLLCHFLSHHLPLFLTLLSRTRVVDLPVLQLKDENLKWNIEL